MSSRSRKKRTLRRWPTFQIVAGWNIAADSCPCVWKKPCIYETLMERQIETPIFLKGPSNSRSVCNANGTLRTSRRIKIQRCKDRGRSLNPTLTLVPMQSRVFLFPGMCLIWSCSACKLACCRQSNLDPFRLICWRAFYCLRRTANFSSRLRLLNAFNSKL